MAIAHDDEMELLQEVKVVKRMPEKLSRPREGSDDWQVTMAIGPDLKVGSLEKKIQNDVEPRRRPVM